MKKTQPDSPILPGGYREMLTIAFPLILSMGSYTIMQFSDRVFLSRYSSVAIQAALPGGILAHSLTCFFQALAGYAGTFVAHYYGAKRHDQCVHSTIQGLWLALLSWPFILLLIPLGMAIMTWSGHSPTVLAAEKSYFTILMMGGVFTPINAAIGGYFMGIGKTKINMIANAAGCLINIGLNYLMIFGHGGFPRMGIEGAAIATVISSLLTCLIQFVIFLREPAFHQAKQRRHETHHTTLWRPDRALLTRIVTFGSPHGLQLLLDLGSFSLFILLTGRLGELDLAASNIALSINNLAFAPLLGFGMATATLVGQHQGAKNAGAAQRAGYTGMKVGWIYMALIGSTFLLFPKFYFTLFSPADATFSADELLKLGRKMLILMTVWGMFDSVGIIIAAALKGAGDTRFVMRAMILGGWLMFVPGIVVCLLCDFGILAMWLWCALYIFVFSICVLWRWMRGEWQQITLIEHAEPDAYLLTTKEDIY